MLLAFGASIYSFLEFLSITRSRLDNVVLEMVESDATTVMSSILLGARLFPRTTLTLEASSTVVNIV